MTRCAGLKLMQMSSGLLIHRQWVQIPPSPLSSAFLTLPKPLRDSIPNRLIQQSGESRSGLSRLIWDEELSQVRILLRQCVVVVQFGTIRRLGRRNVGSNPANHMQSYGVAAKLRRL